MTTTDTPRGAIDIGHVIQTLFGVMGRNFVSFFVLSLILTGLPNAVLGFFQVRAAETGAEVFNLNFFLTGLVSLVTGAVLQGALVYGTVADLNGKRPPLSEVLAVGLRAFLPLIGLSILLGFAVIVGLILLIVPGLVMLVVWAVVAPAYVAERRGIFEAFGRSVDLTRGNRWRIFALDLLYIVAAMILGIVLSAIGGVALLAGPDGRYIEQVLVNPVFNAIFAMIGATGAAVLYVELRRAKEGLGVDALAAIFD